MIDFTKLSFIDDIGIRNTNLIRNISNERDANPPVNLARKDTIIRRFDKKGLYSVKSAYHVCVDIVVNRDERKDA